MGKTNTSNHYIFKRLLASDSRNNDDEQATVSTNKFTKRSSRDSHLRRLQGSQCEAAISAFENFCDPELSTLRRKKGHKHRGYAEAMPVIPEGYIPHIPRKKFFPKKHCEKKFTTRDASAFFQSDLDIGKTCHNILQKINDIVLTIVRNIQSLSNNETVSIIIDLTSTERNLAMYMEFLTKRINENNLPSFVLLNLSIRMLRTFHQIPSVLLSQFRGMIYLTLQAIEQALIKTPKTSINQFSFLVYYCTNLPVDWGKHQKLLESLFNIFNENYLPKRRREKYLLTHVGAIFRILGSFAKLLIILPDEQLENTLAIYLETIEIVITANRLKNQYSQDQYSASFFGELSKQLSMREFHLLWQYCVWHAGTDCYHSPQHNLLVNWLESKMHQRYYSQTDDDDPLDLFDISRFEKQIVGILDSELRDLFAVTITQQQIIGCYSIDIGLTIKQDGKIIQKIAVEAYGPHHYFGKDSRLIRLKDRFRNQLLERLNYTVVLISYFEADGLSYAELRQLVIGKLMAIPAISRLLQPSQRRENLYVPPHMRERQQRKQGRASSRSRKEDWRRDPGRTNGSWQSYRGGGEASRSSRVSRPNY